MSALDEIMEEKLAKKYDFGYRAQELFKAPVETMEEEKLEKFLAELKVVDEGVSQRLTQARLKCCKSLKRWEKCDELLVHIVHRILANPVYLKLLAAGMFEDTYDNLLKQYDS